MSDTTTLLRAALRDADVTREVVLRPGALQGLPALLGRLASGARWMVVADTATWAVAGEAAWRALPPGAAAEPLVLPGTPRLKPLAEHSQAIARRLAEGGTLPLAVGAGVVNDLAKHAAGLAGVPYACVATAASMDGYAASGAALIDADGFKRTLACPPPVAVLADLHVVADAPARMTAWGYGDLAGKVVAGADWVLADALGIEPLNPGPFALVQDHLGGWLGTPERLAAREPEALGALLGGLLVSGFAMQAHGNSRPASGSDHQFSHLWEMEGLRLDGEPAAHGACVGLGCVAMLALYEWLLAQPALDPLRTAVLPPHDEAALAREIDQSFAREEMRVAARAEMAAKRVAGPGPSRDGRAGRAGRFAAVQHSLRPALARRLMPAAEMQRRLRALGAPAHPSDLGLSLADFRRDHLRARLIRRRYTLLDLLEDLGWLPRALDDLFAPGGFWGRSGAHPSNPRSNA